MRVSAHFQKIAKRSLVGLAFLIVLSGLVALGTQVFAADPVRWTGAVSQDWDDAGNWEGGNTPTQTDAVVIDGGALQPILDLSRGSRTVASLTIGGTFDSTVSLAHGEPELKELIISGTLTIADKGVMTHEANAAAKVHALAVVVHGNVVIATGGAIDVSGKGYGNGTGPGNTGTGTAAAHGGNASGGSAYGDALKPLDVGSGGRGGAGGGGGAAANYGSGGAGGVANGGAASTTTGVGGAGGTGGSGSATYMAHGGNGGAGGSGGNGGGSVFLRVDGAIDVQGAIKAKGISGANGANGLYGATGSGNGGNGGGGGGAGGNGGNGGAGGSIYITADSIASVSAGINASGGSGGAGGVGGAAGAGGGTGGAGKSGATGLKGSGGAGGRVSVVSGAPVDGSSILIAAGEGLSIGGAGTSYLRSPEYPKGMIFAGNEGRQAQYDTPAVDVDGAALIVADGAVYAYNSTTMGSRTLDSMIVKAGGKITVKTPVALDFIVNGAATIESGGVIDVSSQGSVPGTGTGAGVVAPATGQGGSGAGYGGAGGLGSATTAGGVLYGSAMTPKSLGSGGGNGSADTGGGSGGGALRISAGDAITIDGSILANGQNASGSGTNARGGGGSGGSIYLIAPAVQGSGSLSANGGSGSTSYGGGGGGGRIAVERTSSGPAIMSVSPRMSGVNGGETITVAGSHFARNSQVVFTTTSGSGQVHTAAAKTVYVDANTLTATVPSSPWSGKTQLAVLNQDLTGTLAVSGGTGFEAGQPGTVAPVAGLGNASAETNNFQYYTKPVVTSATPDTVLNTGGDIVTITGSYFREGAVVRFDGVVVPGVTYVNDTTLTVITPAGYKFGKVDISVTNDDGQVSDTARVLSYRQSAPQIATVAPEVVRASGGQQVTITGSGFYFDVQFSSISASVSHTCGISFGEAYCWGVNSSGQLGDGTTANSVIPVRVAQEPGLLSGRRVTAITTDTSSTCAIADGEAYCWGAGASGRLGNGAVASSLVPSKVTQAPGVLEGKIVTTIASGSNGHVCVVASGEAYCWGNNSNGQLGIGSTTQSTVPVKVTQSATLLQGKVVTDVSLGMHHSCAVASGEAYCWGYNANGQLGINSVTQTTVPSKVVQVNNILLGKTVSALAVGSYHTCVIANAEAYCWGLNSSYQLGTGTTTQYNAPVKVSQMADGLLGKRVTQLTTRDLHTCAIANNEAYCWGLGGSGRLGNGSTANATAPLKVTQDQGVLLGRTVTNISAGSGHTCAIADQKMYCWGNNANGQYGNNTANSVTKPVEVTASFALPLEVRVDGVLRPIASQSPTAITFFTAPHAPGEVDITLGSEYVDTALREHALTYIPSLSVSDVSPATAMTSGGDTVIITGENFTQAPLVSFGGTTATSVTRVSDTVLQVVAPPSSTLGTVSVTVVNGDGAVVELPQAFSYQRAAPVVTIKPDAGSVAGGQMTRLLSSELEYDLEFTKISAGESHVCGIANAKVYCWGRNTYGELGDNTTIHRSLPTLVEMGGVLAGKEIVAVSAGGYVADSPAGSYGYTLALDSEGVVYAWGRNNYGQLGNGTTADSLVPVRISESGDIAGKKVTAIDAGGSHSLALTSDGMVYSWGYNTFGQVGNGTTTNVLSPVSISLGALTGKRLTAVDAGVTHSVALDSDGIAYAWGNNRSGELGDDTTIARSVPVVVSTSGALAGKTLTSVSAGGYYLWNNTNGASYSFYGYTLALDSEGVVYSWGRNNYGQLGNGTNVVANSSPAAVVTTGALKDKIVQTVYAGARHSVATSVDGAVYNWGSNSNGQLGDGSYASANSPKMPTVTGVLDGTVLTSVAASQDSTYALSATGRLYAWGSNNYGQVGNGSVSTVVTTPIGVNMTQGVPFSLAIDGADQHLSDRTSQALVFTTPAHAAGTVPLILAADHVGTFSGSYEYLARPAISSVSPSTAANTGGDTIVITGSHFSRDADVLFGALSASQVTRHSDTTLEVVVPPALTVGAVTVTVMNRDGQSARLAHGFVYTQAPPVITSVTPSSGPAVGGQTVTLSGSGFLKGTQFTEVSASSGNRFSCGVADAKAYCWGLNSEGQLGNGTTDTSLVPAPVVQASGLLEGKTVTAVSAGQAHACAIADGEAYCWGSGASGQLGSNSTAQSTTPVKVAQVEGVLAGREVTSISAGTSFTCAVADGEAYCWGSGANGRLGNSTSASSTVPVKVTQAPELLQYKIVTSVSAGNGYACATADGEAYCWGLGSSGQLGNGTTTGGVAPIKVTQASGILLGKTVTSISAGQSHTCAVADGEAYCWGVGSSGQLGNGTTGQYLNPGKVVQDAGMLLGKTVRSVSSGSSYTCAVADGEAYCWGTGNNGRIGNGAASGAYSRPVKVTQAVDALATKTVESITASFESTCAVASGQLYCWGRNASGELGNGTLVQSASPVYATQSFPIDFNLMIGGVSVPAVSQTQASLVFVTPPATAPGLVDIQLTADNIGSTTLTEAYEYVAAPTITNVSPGSSLKTGGDTIVISGTGFSSDVVVRVGGQPATGVTRISSRTLTAIVPPAAVAGVVDISVQNNDGQTATLTNSFTYHNLAPTIVSIAPSEGPTAGGNTVTITGANFADKNSTSNTWSNTNKTITGGTYGSQLAVVGDTVYLYGGYNTNTILSASVNDPTSWTNTGKTLPSALYGSQLVAVGSKLYLFGGYGSAAIYSADVSDPTTWTNTGKTLPNALGYSQATIVGTKIYLFGGIGSSAIYSADVSDPTTWTNTNKTLPASLGYSQVVVIGSNLYLFGGNNASGAAGNHRNSIYTATTNDPTTWTDTGSTLPVNLALSQVGVIGDTLYLFGGALSNGAYTNAIFSAPTSNPLAWTATGKTLPGAQGISHFAVINSNMYLFAGYGAGTNVIYSAPVSYSEPNISNKAWTTNWRTASADVNSRGLEVRIGGVLSTSSSIVDGTTITAQVPGGMPGLVDVLVTMPDEQTAMLVEGYEYLGPRITNISPARGSTLGGDTVTITGERFVQDGATPPRVSFGGVEATNVQFVSSTELRVTSPVHAAGAVAVLVENYDGESALARSAYTYIRPPVVQSVTPAEGAASGGDTVTITGYDFDDGSVVRFGGIEATQTTFVNNTTLAVTSPAQYPGPRDITVTNLDGQVSRLRGAFTYHGVPPSITSVTPVVGPSAGGTQVTITGSGFDASYKRAVSVVNSSGDVAADGKVFVQLDTASLVSAGKMRADGGDIRFQRENGEVLDYWLERGINTTATYLWVSVSDVPAGVSQIYMTYGIPELTSQSDPSIMDLSELAGEFSTVLLNAQELYIPWPGNSRNVCKAWSMPGGGLISEFTATHATESRYDFFSVSADGVERYRNSGSSGQTVALASPASTLTACLSTDGSNQTGYGGQVSAVKAQVISSVLNGTLGAESRAIGVKFGDQPATVTQMSGTQLRVTTPVHVPGTADVVVTNPYSEQVVRKSAFTYIANFGFTNSPLSVSATEPGKLTIESKDADGQPMASSVDTEIMLSSSSNGGFFARNLDEDSATRWDYSSVILPAGQTTVDIWYRDSLSGTPKITAKVADIVTFTQSQTIGSRYKLQVTGVSNPIQAGVPSSVTVRVVDFSGVPQTGYAGTIRFESTDQAAILPASYTMRQSDNGVKTFVNGVTMRTQGSFCVSATDTVSALIKGEQCGITVLPPNQDAITQLAVISAEQSFPSNGYSSPITIQAQDVRGQPTSVSSDTQVYLYSNSATGEFRTVGQEAWSSAKPYVATIQAGLTSANVQYRDTTARTSVLSARDVTTDTADNGEAGDFGWKNATQSIVSGVGAPTKLSITGPSRLPADERGAYVVEVQDEDGNPVTAESDITVRIDGNTASSSFYRSADITSEPLKGPIEFTIPGGSHLTTIWFSDSVSSNLGAFTTLSLTDARPETESVRLSDASIDVKIGLGDPVKLRVANMADASVRKNTNVHVDMLDEYGNVTYYDAQSTDIALSSDKSGVFSSNQVTVSPGQTGGMAKYYALEDGAHAISASSGILDDGVAELTATPVSLVFAPVLKASADEPVTVAVEVHSQAGRSITLDAPETIINLSSSESSGSFARSGLILRAGEQNVTTTYLDTAVGARMLRATSPHDDVGQGSLEISVTAGAYAQYGNGLRFASPEQTYRAGDSQAFRLGFYDKAGRLTTLESPVTVQLSSTSLTGEFSRTGTPFTPQTTVTIPAGVQTYVVYYRDETVGVPTLTIQDVAGVNSQNQQAASATQVQTVTANAPARVEVVSTPQVIAFDTTSTPIAFALEDAYGNDAVAAQDVVMSVTSSSATGEFAVVRYENGAALPASDWQRTQAVSFAKGDHGAELYYRDSTVGTPTLKGAVNGMASGSQVIEVVRGFPEKAIIVADDTSVVAGETATFTLSLHMSDDTEIAASAPVSVQLSTSEGELSLTEAPFAPVSRITFAKGESRKTVYFRSTTVGTTEITASSFNEQSSDVVEVVSAQLARFGVTPRTVSVPINTASDAMMITTYDIYGNVTADDADTTAYLHSSQSTTRFSASRTGSWNRTSVTIPAGLSSQSFFVRDTAFSNDALHITVSDFPTLDSPDDGIVNGTAELSIVSQPVDSIAFLSSPHTVTAGESSQAIRFELLKADGSRAIQDGTTQVSVRVVEGEGRLALDNTPNNPGVSSVPIDKDSSTGTLYYTGQKAGLFTIEASMQSAKNTQPITVQAGKVASSEFTTLPQSLIANRVSGAIRAVFQDAYGNVASLEESTTVNLSTSCDGQFSETSSPFTPTSSIIAPAGAQDITFFYRDTLSGQCTIQVNATGVKMASQVVTISAGAPVRIDIVGEAATLVKGETSTVVLTMVDEFGNISQAARQTTALLDTTSSSGRFAQQAVTFLPGQSTRTVGYADSFAGVATISVKDQAEMLDGDTKTMTYTEGAPTALRIAPNPSTMRAGGKQTFQVSPVNRYGIVVDATEDMEVSLLSSDASGYFLASEAPNAAIIQTLHIRKGSSGAEVAYTQTASGATKLSVQHDEMSGAAQLTVLAQSVYEVRFTNQEYKGENALQIGQPGVITARLYDRFGNATTTDAALTLYASSKSGEGTLTNNGHIVIAAGNSQGAVSFTPDRPGSYDIVVFDSVTGESNGGLRAIEQSVEAVYGAVTNFKFDQRVIALERGGVTDQMTATLYNRYDRVVPAGAGGQRVALTMYEGTGTFALTANGLFTPSLTLAFAEGESTQSYFYRNDDAQIENRQCYVTPAQTRVCYTAFRYTHTIRGAGDAGITTTRLLPVTMRYGDVARLVFTTPERSQPAQHASQVLTVEQQNQYGKPVIAYADTQFYVRSSAGATGEFGSSATNWGVNRITVLNSSSTASFYYRDKQAGVAMITVADSLPVATDIGIVNAVQQVTIQRQAVDNLLVTNISDPQQQGTPSSVIVIARDAQGYTVESYSGTVTFVSSDAGAILPSSYTFNPAIDKGSKTFTNAVAFRSPGEKSVRVIDEAGHMGSQDNITVTGANTAPVAQVLFAQPDSPFEAIRGASTPALTVQLRDSAGMPTTAGVSGYDIRLTSQSSTGEFAASPGGPWVSSLVATVPEGLSYLNVYYRDEKLGSAQLLVSDWNSATNTPSVVDGVLEVVMRTIRIEGASVVQSRNAFGQFEDSTMLFAHNAAGDITGSARNTFNAFSLETGVSTAVDWRLQWRQGVARLQDGTAQASSTANLLLNGVVTSAGKPDFYAIAEATTTTFAIPGEVVSRQLTAPVSPWRVAVIPSAHYVQEGAASSFALTTRNGTTVTAPTLTIASVVHADATDNSEPVYGVTINGGSGDASVAIPEDALPLGEYRLFAASYDVNGNTLAQDLSDVFAVVEELPEPEAPVNPGHVAGDGTPITLPDPEKPGVATPPATDAPVAEQGDTTSDAETPALDGGDAERVPSTQPGNEEVGEAVDESTGFIEAVKKFLQSPNAPAVISGAFASVIGLIIVALIYQAYREWRQAQWLLAVIKRDQQTVADKDAFLRLAAHYLRTPMSLIDSGASLLQRLQGDESSRLLAAALEGISHSMRGKIELILGQTLDANELTTITAQTTGQARLKIAASPIFWAPVIASVLLTVVANTIIVTYGGQMLAGQQVLQQFFILAFAGIVLYMAARFVAMRRERTEKLKASQSKIRILNTAKMAFVQRTYEGLSDDVLHLSGYDVSSVQNDVVRQAIDDGATRLKELVSRFAVLSSIRPEYIRSKPFSVEELVSESLREVPDAIRTSLRIDNKASDLRLVQDERFLGKVITTIFETISSDTSLNSVTIEGAKKKSGVTTLTLTSQLNGALGAPGEELFSIYSSEGNEEAATYSSDESKHRLDLYLDRMIMSQLGGDIKTRHSDRSFQVQLTIPSGVS